METLGSVTAIKVKPRSTRKTKPPKQASSLEGEEDLIEEESPPPKKKATRVRKVGNLEFKTHGFSSLFQFLARCFLIWKPTPAVENCAVSTYMGIIIRKPDSVQHCEQQRSDQHAHLPSLVSPFIIRFGQSCYLQNFKGMIRSAVAQCLTRD